MDAAWGKPIGDYDLLRIERVNLINPRHAARARVNPRHAAQARVNPRHAARARVNPRHAARARDQAPRSPSSSARRPIVLNVPGLV
jgi:hypothetical protein